MILTVTINPLFERRFKYNKINFDSVNRNGKLSISAGGKGINVSRQLKHLNVVCTALTFIGGNNGKLYREAAAKENLNLVTVRTETETREASVLTDEEKPAVYSFFSSNPGISIKETDEFKDKLKKMISNSEIVVFSGSSPCKEADTIFPFGIETANFYDKVSVLDTYGRHLKNCISRSPTIIHNTRRELEDSLRISLKTEKEKIDFLNDLYAKGIKQAYITDGAKDTYASNFDYHFKVINALVTEKDPTGSGDSFTAGIVYGWYKDLTFEESLTLASSLGSVNACKLSTSSVNFEEIEKVKKSIRILPIGKKIKLIDVTPL